MAAKKINVTQRRAGQKRGLEAISKAIKSTWKNKKPFSTQTTRDFFDTYSLVTLVTESEDILKIIDDLDKAIEASDPKSKKIGFTTTTLPGIKDRFSPKQGVSKKLDLSAIGTRVDLDRDTVEKFRQGKLNFLETRDLLNEMVPNITKFYNLGHSDYSNLQQKVALLMSNIPKNDPRRPQLRALSRLILTVDKETQNINTETQVKDISIDKMVDIINAAESDWDASIIYENILKSNKVAGIITIDIELQSINKLKGAMPTGSLGKWLSQLEKNISSGLADLDLDYTGYTGSPSMRDAIAEMVSSRLDPRRSSIKKIAGSKRKTKLKLEGLDLLGPKKQLQKAQRDLAKKAAKLKRSESSNRSRKPDTNGDNLRLAVLLDSRIRESVIANMVSPALVNRTGRFANNVRIMGVTDTGTGIKNVDYAYLEYPYNLFEMGNSRLATPQRDPRRIIDTSIRQIAAQVLTAKFTTRRV